MTEPTDVPLICNPVHRIVLQAPTVLKNEESTIHEVVDRINDRMQAATEDANTELERAYHKHTNAVEQAKRLDDEVRLPALEVLESQKKIVKAELEAMIELCERRIEAANVTFLEATAESDRTAAAAIREANKIYKEERQKITRQFYQLKTEAFKELARAEATMKISLKRKHVSLKTKGYR